MSKLRTTLSDNMARYRKMRDWDQVDLAAAADMSVGGVRGYEQKKRWPDPEVLERISVALGTEPADLLGMAPKPSPEQALKVLAEFVESTRKSKVNVTPAPLADALRAALKDSEFKYVATAIKNITGGRVQLELPDEEDQASN